MGSIKTKPRSIKEIRKKANLIRTVVKRIHGQDEEFPIIEFVESYLPQIFDEFILHVEEVNVMNNNHGLTDVKSGTIRLREDVYNGACDGKGRDRFTIAHELGHLLLHSQDNLELARSDNEIKAYENPEWQANRFAAELLMPLDLITSDDTVETLSRRFGVTYSAAEVRLNSLGM